MIRFKHSFLDSFEGESYYREDSGLLRLDVLLSEPEHSYIKRRLRGKEIQPEYFNEKVHANHTSLLAYALRCINY